jgi:transposase-like protein
MDLTTAANEARVALENGWREVIDCPYCSHGSTHHHEGRGTTSHRCAYCRGVGRIYRDTLVIRDTSRLSSAEYAAYAASGLDFLDPAPSADE